MPITSQITLTGNPIAYGKASRAIAYMQRPYVVGTVVGLAFCAAASICSPGGPVFSAVCSLGLLTGSSIISTLNKIEGALFSMIPAEKTDLCIETKPTKTTPDNDEIWLDFAKSAKAIQHKHLRQAIIYGAALCAVLGSFPGGSPWEVGVVGSLALPSILHYACGLQRWRNVERNEWRIVQRTPPKKETAKARGWFARFVPSFNPA